jgi:hypothetical protein
MSADPEERLLAPHGHGVDAGPLVELDRHADPFAAAQQHVQVAAQLGQVGRVARKWPQPTQRNRNGQAPPPTLTLLDAEQTPNGTATAPTAWRWC